MKLVPFYFLALVGVLLGGGLLTSSGLTSGTLLMLPLVALSLSLCRRIDRQEQQEVGLAQIFLLSVTLRWVVSAFVHEVVYARQPGLFAPDEYFYDFAGRYYAEFLSGHVPDPSPGVFTGGIIWWTAISHYLVGSAMGPALLNGVMGAWTAVMTSLIALTMFSPAVARRAGVIAAFAPSLVLWSSLNIKDTSTLLGAQVVIYSALELRRSFRITAVVGPNAAGKTTLIKAILGLVRLEPGGGDVLIDSIPVGQSSQYRERIGYMAQAARFPPHLTGREVIAFLRGRGYDVRSARRATLNLEDYDDLVAVKA